MKGLEHSSGHFLDTTATQKLNTGLNLLLHCGPELSTISLKWIMTQLNPSSTDMANTTKKLFKPF